MRTVFLLLTSACVALALLLPFHQRAEAEPAATAAKAARTLELDITETPRTADKSQTARTLHLTLVLVDGAPTARLITRSGNSDYQVKVHQLGGKLALTMLEIEGPGLSLSAATRLVPGQRVIIGSVAADDGSATEIAALLQ